MHPVPDSSVASLVVSALVLLTAALLAWREARERSSRGEDLSPADERHFGHQDGRRRFGIVLLGFLAAGIVAGSRLPPRIGNRANPVFLGVWLILFAMILALLALAMIDWVALRLYARRQRTEILRERVEILREEARRRQAREADGNGHADGPVGDLFR